MPKKPILDPETHQNELDYRLNAALLIIAITLIGSMSLVLVCRILSGH